MGVDSSDTYPLQAFLYGAVPFALLNPGDPDRAWEQLLTMGSGYMWSAKQVVLALRQKEPAALRKVSEAILTNADAPKAQTYLEAMRTSYARVAEQASTLRAVLSNRLGLDG